MSFAKRGLTTLLVASMALPGCASAAVAGPARDWSGLWIGFGAGYAGSSTHGSGGSAEGCLTSNAQTGIGTSTAFCNSVNGVVDYRTSAAIDDSTGGIVASQGHAYERITTSTSVSAARGVAEGASGSVNSIALASTEAPGVATTRTSVTIGSDQDGRSATAFADGSNANLAKTAGDISYTAGSSIPGALMTGSSLSSVNSRNGVYGGASFSSATTASASAEALVIGFGGLPGTDLSGSDGGLSPNIHARYDYQTAGNIVAGVEFDLTMPGGNGASASSMAAVDPDGVLSIDRGYKTRSSFLASARLRLGYAMGDYMVYGTGGLAYTDFDTTAFTSGTYDGHATGTSVSRMDYAWGGVVGGGVQTFVSDNAAVSLEGLYYRYDKQVDLDMEGGGTSVTLDDSFSVMMKFSIRAN